MEPSDLAARDNKIVTGEREAELARALRIGRVGGFEIDLRGGQFLNRRSPEYLEVDGLPPESAGEGHDAWVQRLHPDDRRWADAHFKQTVASQSRFYTSEYRIIVPGEGIRWIAAFGEIDRDDTGAPLRMVGVHIDITRTKEAEDALRVSEARLRQALETIGEAFYTLDADGRFTTINRRALEMWDLVLENVIGRRLIEIFPEAANGVPYQALLHSMTSGTHSRVEAIAVSLAGRWVEQDVYPNADGGVAVAVRDIHDRKQAEIALKESERRLRDLNESLEELANERARQLASSRAQLQAFFDNSPDWLTLQRCTPDGQFIFVDINPTCEVAYGLPREQVVGRTVEAILGLEAAQVPIAHFRECLRTGEPQRYVTRRTMAGVTRFIDVISSLVPEHGEGGDRFLLTWARDLTDREKLEAQLRQAQKMEAIGQLTGGVAHDFNNLLAIIIGSATLIKRGSAIESSRLIDNILSAGERGAALTRRLLSLSRHQPQTRQIVHLSSEMPRIVETLRSSLRGDIELHVTADPEIQPIDIDLGELEIAFLNVAVNARDAMPTGGQFFVEVRNRDPGGIGELPRGLSDGHVMISLRDTGHGMPREVISRAFEPFFTTKEPGSGTGLGLSQVFAFADSASGTVTIESEVGTGTTVNMYVPVTAKVSSAPVSAARESRAEALNGRVLLVDDNEEVMNVIATMLRAMGLQVETADRAHAAFSRICTGPPDVSLLLTDVVMPGMNGLDLARKVRELLPEIPIVLMSGYNEVVQTRQKEFPLLRKPTSYEALFDTICDLINSHE